MRVFDVSPSARGPLAIEISSALGRRRAARVVEAIPGAHIKRRPKLIARLDQEVFCEFELEGQQFNIWEPHGSSGRYWIGPSSGKKTPVLLRVRQAFIDHKTPARRGIARWITKA
ncbi:MAG: hypothetical protein JSS44_10005 [Proteobacteria bacterium]|nr:hypothetical protein [Pseudomonadota bacterium]MBS0460911.1 hypothetical protein [Pseudomonadota bacterium]MBS0464401.1 hypothetical protein [Pseudomonadota bacterium]